MIPVLLGIVVAAIAGVVLGRLVLESLLAEAAKVRRVMTCFGKDYLVVPADEYRAKVEDLEAARSRLARLREAMDETAKAQVERGES